MKNTIILLLIAFTITNAIFTFMQHNALLAHQEVINRQGTIITFLLQTPEVQTIVEANLKNQQGNK